MPLRSLHVRSPRWLLAFVLLCSTLVSFLPMRTAVAQSSDAQNMSVEDVVEEVGQAVVTVLNLTQIKDGQGITGELQAASSGTGFIIDKDGHIVTNWHVVTGGDAYAVILSDGTQLSAKLIGSDPRDDLAVVKIDAASVPDVVSFGSSADLKPGAAVVAIGSPLGAFTNTVTDGIISGLGRNEFSQQDNPQCQNYTNLIQHTAAINHGNSGGPLFNLKGEVIGVNTLGLPTYNGEPVQGLFFAVPSDSVKKVSQELIENGEILAPYMGANLLPVTPDLNAAYDLSTDSGAFVYGVERGSAAANAGLQEEDIILEIDGKAITEANPLSTILFDYKPGDTVKLTVQRVQDNQWVKGTLELTFDQTPADVFASCQLEG